VAQAEKNEQICASFLERDSQAREVRSRWQGCLAHCVLMKKLLVKIVKPSVRLFAAFGARQEGGNVGPIRVVR
jgi:hypothetical protein